MRLKNRMEAPAGGFYYIHKQVKITGATLRNLVMNVGDAMRANGEGIPGNLADMIEDSICMRISEGKCWYSAGLGDRISKVVHSVAGVIDRVAGTDLKSKARKCSACAGRRNRLNARTEVS